MSVRVSLRLLKKSRSSSAMRGSYAFDAGRLRRTLHDGDRTGTHLPERASGPRAAADRRLSAHAAAARDQPADVDRGGEPRAGRRSPAVPVAAEHRQRTSRSRATCRRIGTIAAIRQMAKVPNGGIHVIVEGLTRAKAELVTQTGDVAARDGVAAAGGDRADARNRRLRPAPARADRPRAVARRAACRRNCAAWSPGIDDPLRLAYLLASLLDMKAEEKQQILEDNDAHRQAAGGRRRAQPRDRAARDEGQDRVGRAAGDDRRAAAVLPAPAAQGDPGRARRRREDRGRRSSAARLADAKLPEAVATVAEREVDRLERMTPASPEYQMIRTYIDWVLDVPWSTTTEDRLDPVAARAGARRGSLRSRQGQGAHRRVPRGAEAEDAAERRAADQGADPLLRRPAGRRQDLARPVDRARDEPQVRAHLARRRARRGGDPRPPAHLHRRHSRPHRAGAEAGRAR